MSYDLEQINKQIESCLAGEGSFDLLRQLQAQKADILDRQHFDSIQTIKAAIQALEAQLVTDYEAATELQTSLEKSALVIEEKAEMLLKARQDYAIIETDLFFKRTAIENNKMAAKEKKAELSELIANKINGANNNE
jgi:hypothetical protein